MEGGRRVFGAGGGLVVGATTAGATGAAAAPRTRAPAVRTAAWRANLVAVHMRCSWCCVFIVLLLLLVSAGVSEGASSSTTTTAASSTDTGLICYPGYHLVNDACQDVNECAQSAVGQISPPVCDPRTVCTNTAGSFECGPCPVNYKGDGKTGCIREPSLDVIDGNLVFHIDDAHDLAIRGVAADGETTTSLRSAVSAALATKQDLASTKVDVRLSLESLSTHVSTQTEGIDTRHDMLSMEAGDVSLAVTAVKGELEDAVFRLGNVSELADAGHTLARALQEEIAALTLQLNTTDSTVDHTLSLISGLDQRIGDAEDSLESTDVSLMLELSRTQSELSAMRECALMGMVHDGAQCVPACTRLSACDGAPCSLQTRGTLRYLDDKAEICDGNEYTSIGAVTTGISPVDPAESCQELKDLGYVTGVYYIGSGTQGRTRLCDLSGTTGVNLGGDGTSEQDATRDCSKLSKYFGLETGLHWIEGDDGQAYELVCDTKTGDISLDGSSPSFAAESCKAINAVYPDRATGTRWITAGLQDPFKVTCVGDWVELKMSGSDFADNAWMFSYSCGNSWTKCGCFNDLENKRNNWQCGVVSPEPHTLDCQVYFDIGYMSGGVQLSDAQIIALSGRAKNDNDRNFNMHTLSCDDDSESYPDGHWIGVEKTPGSNNFVARDCTTGNVNCCSRQLVDNFDTFPLPLRGCASINTGGGVILYASSSTLRIRI